MPPPLLERMALELPRIVLLLILVVLGFGPVPAAADDLKLQAQHAAEFGFDRARAERTQQHRHINKLRLIHLTGRFRRDRTRHLGRPLGQLGDTVMLNAGLARHRNSARVS